MANILVTGANGQLGRELRILSDIDINNKYTFTDIEQLDITNAEDVENFIYENKPDFIVNCAAYTAVDKAESQPELCKRINATAVKNIANAASHVKSKVIHISTDYVYSGDGKTPYTEEDAVSPRSVYGETKLAGEKALFEANPNSVVIRTAWLYSPFGKNFVKTMIALGLERENINVVCDQRGTPTYAADLAAVITKIINSDKFVAGLYNYTDRGECTWYEFSKEIHSIYGIDGCKVSPVSTDSYPSIAVRPSYSVLDKTKIEHTYQVDIPDWKESLQKCILRIKKDNI